VKKVFKAFKAFTPYYAQINDPGFLPPSPKAPALSCNGARAEVMMRVRGSRRCRVAVD